MTTFKDFLSEEASEEKLKHLEHAEDHVIHGGQAGFSHAYHNLKDVHDRREFSAANFNKDKAL